MLRLHLNYSPFFSSHCKPIITIALVTMIKSATPARNEFFSLNISLAEGQCLRAKLPDTANVAIQIGGTQVHERYATKQNDFDEKKVLYRGIDDDIQMSEFALQKNVPLEVAHLDLLATAGPRTIHVYDKLCVAVLSTDSGKTRDSNRIMVMSALKGLNIQHTIYFQCGIIYYK
ncbi:unnamed protein product [Rotaria socialis]|uniref:Uncharacterized protein n=1 Tax=Rotaria socialis TaxID=392032 RepID=A0A821NYE6_9BILA|nr:unnamed protein product [Rotaria socialis]